MAKRKEKKFMTCDSNCVAAHVAYMLSAKPTAYRSEVAAIYPITPSSQIV